MQEGLSCGGDLASPSEDGSITDIEAIRVAQLSSSCFASFAPVVVNMVATVFTNVDVASLVLAYPASSLCVVCACVCVCVYVCVCRSSAHRRAHGTQKANVGTLPSRIAFPHA